MLKKSENMKAIRRSFLEELNVTTNYYEIKLARDDVDQEIREIILTEGVLGDLTDEECDIVYTFIKPVYFKNDFVQKVMRDIMKAK